MLLNHSIINNQNSFEERQFVYSSIYFGKKKQYFAINSWICTLTIVVIPWRIIFSISINPLFIFCTYNRFCHVILKAGDKATSVSGYDEYISDLAKPVPYISDNYMMKSKPTRHYKEYMDDDQKFTSRRTDVLVYKTPVLTDDLIM
jgi:hypothetical protein